MSEGRRSGDSQTVTNGLEYALYALAIRLPDLFTEAERFSGGMLASDPEALRRVKALITKEAGGV